MCHFFCQRSDPIQCPIQSVFIKWASTPRFILLSRKLYDLLIHTLTNSVSLCLTNYNILMGIFSTLFNDSLETGSTEILVSKRCGIINCPGWNLPSMIFTVLVITQGIVYIHNTAVAELSFRCSPSSPHFMVSHRAFRKESLDHLLHDVAGITGYPVAEVTLTPDSPVWHRTIFSLKTFHSLYNFCLCNKAYREPISNCLHFMYLLHSQRRTIQAAGPLAAWDFAKKWFSKFCLSVA